MSNEIDVTLLSSSTHTPMSYRNRITVEFALNFTSWSVNLLLFFFVRFRKNIWITLKSTIVFVTTGSLLINLPLLTFQFWMVINLQLNHQPQYSILICSFLKNVCSSTTSSYQVLPFAVSLYRYRTLVLKSHPTVKFVIYTQVIVTILFIFYAFLNFPFGENQTNDVCHVLRFSIVMELIRIFSTLFFNFFAIFVNLVMFRFVRKFEKTNSETTQSIKVQLTRSLLIQSIVPVLVSFPLLLGSFEFYFGIPLPKSFSTTWYATTFLGPVLMPLSSILTLPSTRKELFNFLLLTRAQKSTVTSIVVTAAHNSKTDRTKFMVRDSC